MNRYYGQIGYANESEVSPGVWKANIEERSYYGDILKNKTNIQQGNTVNPTITISNSISILADQFAYKNINNIRYITFRGEKWCISNIEINAPRIILSLGGVYK